MEQQKDVTGGSDSGIQQTPASAQQPQQAGGRPPLANPYLDGQHSEQGDQYRPRNTQAEGATEHDPLMYRQAVSEALAAQQSIVDDLNRQFPDPSYDPYGGPPEPFLDEFADRFGQRLQGMGGEQVLDPITVARELYSEVMADLPHLMTSLLDNYIGQASQFGSAVDAFFEDHPGLEVARPQITRLLLRNVPIDEILQLLDGMDLGHSSVQRQPTPAQRRQLRNETFVETGAADPYTEPATEDEDRMIQAAVNQLFGE